MFVLGIVPFNRRSTTAKVAADGQGRAGQVSTHTPLSSRAGAANTNVSQLPHERENIEAELEEDFKNGGSQKGQSTIDNLISVGKTERVEKKGGMQGSKEARYAYCCSEMHRDARTGTAHTAHAHARDPRNGATVLTVGAGSTAGISRYRTYVQCPRGMLLEYMVYSVWSMKTVCCILTLYALYCPDAVGMPVMLCAVW
mgnify:CR=1 FL=1